MSDDQFTKLFKYIEEFRREVRNEFATVHAQIDHIYDTIDGIMKKQETDEQERLAMGRQLARHDQWIERAAPVVKIKYPKL